ncbi:MAG TPA: ion channel [Anaeromyxobacter sp.]
MRVRRKDRIEVVRADGYEMRTIGVPSAGLRDVYHWFLRVPWWGALGAIVGAYLLLNALFALVYLAVGGVAGAARGSFLDAFFFSIETMGTIGYGAMYPASRAANLVMAVESIVGILVVALVTGLAFARFSLARARVVFSRQVAVGPYDGVPTVMIRLGNERRGRIVDAWFRLSLMRTQRSADGSVAYRTTDLALVRDRAPALSRSWTVLHRILEGSPLAGETPESLAAAEAELTLAVIGTDETSLQAVHAQHTWTTASIVWGTRLADVLSETPAGDVVLDLRRFHDLTPTAPIPGFPYGERADAGRAGGDGAAPAGERPGPDGSVAARAGSESSVTPDP